jgi:DNA-binding LacI/PurR family transcriptional regulator
MDEKVPALLGGTPFPGIQLPSMDFDMRAIGVHAAEMFLKLGHRRVAVLNAIASFSGELRAEEGFAEVFQQHPDPGNQPLFLRHDETVGGIRRLIEGTLKAPDPPTAFLVSGAGHALTVLSYLLQAGRRVPQDVSLICGDEHPYLSSTIPSIAHYDFDWDAQAGRLARATLRLARRGSLPLRAALLYPKFVRGESLAPPQ